MRLLVDENIPRQTVLALRDLGHDVRDVRGTDQEGVDDRVLWNIAQDEGRLIVTADMDFGARRAEPNHGILIVRLRQPNRLRIHHRVMQVLAHIPPREWPGLLVTARDVAISQWRQPRPGG